jgi:hypothetical protein
MTKLTNVGLDTGNRRTKITIQAIDKQGNLEFNKDGSPKLLNASIPSLYAFDEPAVVRDGKEKKIDAFSLLFKVPERNGNIRFWFGNDTLASENIIGQKIDSQKYSKSHIQKMLQAVLYQWSRQHKRDLSLLGKLNICASMPPGSYQKSTERKKAESAYRQAFNTGQSHIQMRDGKNNVQIVTQFHSLVREAVVWGADIPRQNELILVVDLGGGTDDVVLFNGSSEPVDSKTYKTGLIKTYHKINPTNPEQVELKILKDKLYLPPALVTYFNQKELMVQLALRELPGKMSKRVYLIGGGAVLIARNKSIKSSFLSLVPPRKLIIKDQYATSRANWKEASK